MGADVTDECGRVQDGPPRRAALGDSPAGMIRSERIVGARQPQGPSLNGRLFDYRQLPAAVDLGMRGFDHPIELAVRWLKRVTEGGMVRMMEIDGQSATPDHLAALALYNYGHFTSMTVESGSVRGLSLHLDRLVRDCQTLFGTELDRDWVRRLVQRVVRGESSPCVVRITVFAPDLELAHPAADVEPHVSGDDPASFAGPASGAATGLGAVRARSAPS